MQYPEILSIIDSKLEQLNQARALLTNQPAIAMPELEGEPLQAPAKPSRVSTTQSRPRTPRRVSVLRDLQPANEHTSHIARCGCQHFAAAKSSHCRCRCSTACARGSRSFSAASATTGYRFERLGPGSSSRCIGCRGTADARAERSCPTRTTTLWKEQRNSATLCRVSDPAMA
jgi:hypothetical protein